MRPILWVLLVGWAVCGHAAQAQQLDLSWDRCGGGPTEKILDCADLAAVDAIVVTFVPGVAVAGLVGLEAEIGITSQGPLPDYWHVEPGGCNEGSFALSLTPPTGSGAACTSPWGTSAGSPLMFIEAPDGTHRNRARIRVWISRSGPLALVPGSEYFAFRLLLDHANAGACGGCDQPMVITLNSLRLLDRQCPSGRLAAVVMKSAVRNDLIAANTTLLPVAPASRELALAGARRNPVAGRDLVVDFSLPDASPAWIELLDITGRRVARREVGALGAGPHSVRLDEASAIRPGVYHLRLVNASAPAQVRKTVILQ